MAVNLSIKGVPDDLAERLRRRAERNHRSLQGELMSIVAAAAEDDGPGLQPAGRQQGRLTFAEFAARCREIMPAWEERFGRSVDIIREMRDRG